MNKKNSTLVSLSDAQHEAISVLDAGRTLVNRSYLSELKNYAVQPLLANTSLFNPSIDLRIFRIERIVQENKQSVLESITAAYTALGAAGYSVFLFLQSNGQSTDVYIGTRGEAGKAEGQHSGELLQATFKGHFPGSDIVPLNANETKGMLKSVADQKDNPSVAVTAVTSVPSLSIEEREFFIQGLERFIDAAENEVYQAIILAESVSQANLNLIKIGFEQVSTQISPLLKNQISFGEQLSDNVGYSYSKGINESLGLSLGLTETKGTNQSSTETTTNTSGISESSSSQTGMSKVVSIAAPIIGGLLGGPPGAMAGAMLGGALAKTKTTGTSSSISHGESVTEGISSSTAVSQNKTTTTGVNQTDTHTIGTTLGSSRQFTIESVDKSIEQMLGKIDHHLQRIDEAKAYGGWNTAAYFIGDSSAASESLASVFLGLMRGSNSSSEDFALTTWSAKNKNQILNWLCQLTHPRLTPQFSENINVSYLTPATLVSSKEMALQLSLPRRSTSTVTVLNTTVFGRKIQSLDRDLEKVDDAKNQYIKLGRIRHLWRDLPQEIVLDKDQISSHVFISGSTGSGKSNTVYELLDQLDKLNIPFMVIEPTKGEYKHVFGSRSNVSVYGTNPKISQLLRLNPFRFPDSIHVLEHIDRLIDIFNVCWPMYSAMPAVLKQSIIQAYENSGWDLLNSVNLISDSLFPNFIDILHELHSVIESSAYSQEVKGNYIGSLAMRIGSLTNGLNGEIFSSHDIPDSALFDERVIIDLSRIGSIETKALIMGILVMKLSEYRSSSARNMNLPLQHVTVLEEAHNLLPKTSTSQSSETSNITGKSVEMLSNAIAEMRTYGEGFIIVDQSPGAVDISAIRNTNTKIILRLPEESDRRLLGKSAALSDEQLEEVAKLPKGVAVVYQNNWIEPVLCKVNKFKAENLGEFKYVPRFDSIDLKKIYTDVIYFLLKTRSAKPIEIDVDFLARNINRLNILVSVRVQLLRCVSEYKRDGVLEIWEVSRFNELSRLIVNLLNCREQVFVATTTALDYSELNRLFEDIIKSKIQELDLFTRMELFQCFVKDFSGQSKEYVGIYSSWKQHSLGEFNHG